MPTSRHRSGEARWRVAPPRAPTMENGYPALSWPPCTRTGQPRPRCRAGARHRSARAPEHSHPSGWGLSTFNARSELGTGQFAVILRNRFLDRLFELGPSLRMATRTSRRRSPARGELENFGGLRVRAGTYWRPVENPTAHPHRAPDSDFIFESSAIVCITIRRSHNRAPHCVVATSVAK